MSHHSTKHHVHVRNNGAGLVKRDDHHTLVEHVSRYTDLLKSIEGRMMYQVTLLIQLAWGAFVSSLFFFFIINLNAPGVLDAPIWLVVARTALYYATMPLQRAMARLGSHDVMQQTSSQCVHAIVNLFGDYALWNICMTGVYYVLRVVVSFFPWLGGAAIIRYFQLGSIVGEPLSNNQAQLNYGRTGTFLLVMMMSAVEYYLNTYVYCIENAEEIVETTVHDNSQNPIHRRFRVHQGPPPLDSAHEVEPLSRMQRREFATLPPERRIFHDGRVWLRSWSSMLTRPLVNTSIEDAKWETYLREWNTLQFFVLMCITGSALRVEQLLCGGILDGYSQDLGFYIGARFCGLIVVPLVFFDARFIAQFREFVSLPYIVETDKRLDETTGGDQDESDTEDDE